MSDLPCLDQKATVTHFFPLIFMLISLQWEPLDKPVINQGCCISAPQWTWCDKSQALNLTLQMLCMCITSVWRSRTGWQSFNKAPVDLWSQNILFTRQNSHNLSQNTDVCHVFSRHWSAAAITGGLDVLKGRVSFTPRSDKQYETFFKCQFQHNGPSLQCAPERNYANLK